MSDMEHNKGKLIPFELTEESARELTFLKAGDYVLADYCDTYLEQVADDPEWYGISCINNKFYKVKWEIQRGEMYGFERATKNSDGTIDFETYHYNGGGHWTECVESALND